MEYINHSGGARGSDIAWEILGKDYGVKTIAYSFEGHRCLSPNRAILTDNELMEGWEKVLITSHNLNRNLHNITPYVRKLLSRNWFQVKNSDAIFAIGIIINPKKRNEKGYINSTGKDIVDGGTGYAVDLAITFTEKPVYIFEQNLNKWFLWNKDKFEEISYIPTLTENFAGIGTREINDNGIEAIKNVYKNTFS